MKKLFLPCVLFFIFLSIYSCRRGGILYELDKLSSTGGRGRKEVVKNKPQKDPVKEMQEENDRMVEKWRRDTEQKRKAELEKHRKAGETISRP